MKNILYSQIFSQKIERLFENNTLPLQRFGIIFAQKLLLNL